MALAPFAMFVVSDMIAVDRSANPCNLGTYPQHLNRVLTDEAAYGSYLLAPVVEPDLSRPYSAILRRQYNSAGKELPPAEYPPPVSADLLTPAKNPFVGAALESCAA